MIEKISDSMMDVIDKVNNRYGSATLKNCVLKVLKKYGR
jgi:hypothetical protein